MAKYRIRIGVNTGPAPGRADRFRCKGHLQKKGEIVAEFFIDHGFISIIMTALNCKICRQLYYIVK